MSGPAATDLDTGRFGLVLMFRLGRPVIILGWLTNPAAISCQPVLGLHRDSLEPGR